MGELELKVAKEVKKEEVEELINEKKEVTNEKIEESLNYDLLSPEEKDAIDEFNQKLDIEDSAEVLQYGAKAQAKISEFSDSVLAGVKTKDTGAVGDLLSNLVVEIKSFDSEIADGNKKGIAKLFNNAKKQVEKILSNESEKNDFINKIYNFN